MCVVGDCDLFMLAWEDRRANLGWRQASQVVSPVLLALSIWQHLVKPTSLLSLTLWHAEFIDAMTVVPDFSSSPYLVPLNPISNR